MNVAFLTTGGYIAILFGVGAWFVYKERHTDGDVFQKPEQLPAETVYSGAENRHVERRRRALSEAR